MIPFLDLGAATAEIRDELDEAYHRFMDSGWYVLGKEVDSFEQEYATYCEANHCVGVGTGLDALTLALRSLDIGPGDEVIVPSNTYIATWLAVTQVGATIVPVEPDERTYNLNPKLLQAAITKRTKAIMPVNLYGQPVDYDAIRDCTQDTDIKLVIDNAQAQGAQYKGRTVGGIADIECHSFYPSKNLGAFGEGGAVTTNDETVAKRIRSLRNYGSTVRYHNDECGVNSRLDALQAAFLRVKLRHLDEWNQRRRGIAAIYLEDLAPLTPRDPQFILPFVPDWADPVWHLFVIRTPHRDALREHLQQHDIGTQIHYPIPPHASDAYSDLGFPSDAFPLANQLTDEVLSLPMGPQLPPTHAMSIAIRITESLSTNDEQ
ncbi:dTDP-3-amino-3,6-dideoxy-alpha-D-galactopyranose transaminase [Rosistilla oblonga]|uniref:DegT/DnrJ/EryC1/StrS family aminotransferase n=1 Tax=Rosistilla oblonga TaxID=2527990 RepID=UPI00118B5AE9|nr:DegT/DnrJ/EryC1/StrS family aminotransferase [Rosistilla oblonga]QDV12564.1 dTDP-3-amino-3,6-dideoxy-alpha-D-galactopyranose transaminase [Rosistilla oblonga]